MTSFLCIASPNDAGLRRLDVAKVPELFAEDYQGAELPQPAPWSEVAATWRAATRAVKDTLTLLRREAEARRRQNRSGTRAFIV